MEPDVMNTSREMANVLKRLKEPAFFIHAVGCWAKLGYRVLLKKLDKSLNTGLYQSFFYPRYAKPILTDRISYKFKKGYLNKFDDINGHNENNFDNKNTVPQKIRLATTEISFDRFPDWSRNFDDIEDSFSLNRWGWLLMKAVDSPSVELKIWGVKAMEDWFKKMGHQKNHHCWESYSASERIVNAVLFFYTLRSIPFKGDLTHLEGELFETASYLLKHLEFHGEHTNNHIINNARALYILGRVASCKILDEMGRQIFLNETPLMIKPSGFLREDSTSYQFLIFRTYLEILWAAELTSDRKFAEFIKPCIRSVAGVVRNFLVFNRHEGCYHFPLIGDITPDFPVSWLSDICFSRPVMEISGTENGEAEILSGWNRIWHVSGIPEIRKEIKPKIKSGWQVNADEGWYRLDLGEMTVFWHANPLGNVPLYSHGHNDALSFTLYWNGSPVIIDPGRFNYKQDALGQYGKGTSAHNAFSLDGFESFAMNRSIYPDKYRKAGCRVKWGEKDEGFYFQLTLDGYKRINKNISASRKFVVSHNKIRILDSVRSPMLHQVKTTFHFGERIELITAEDILNIRLGQRDKEVQFKILSNKVEPDVALKKGIKGPQPAGWIFPGYGRAIPTNTLIIDVHSVNSYNMEYAIELHQ